MIENLTPAEWEAVVDAEIAWHDSHLPVDPERAEAFSKRSAMLNSAMQKVRQLAPPHVDAGVPLRPDLGYGKNLGYDDDAEPADIPSPSGLLPAGQPRQAT